MIAIWTLAAMVYFGGVLGVVMATAEKDLIPLLDQNEPRTWKVLLALCLVVAWPAIVTAVLVYKVLK